MSQPQEFNITPEEGEYVKDLLMSLRPSQVPREELAYIHTFGGKRWKHADPQPDDVLLEDISHALSNLCRFTGHVKQFYSIAEHSLRVSYLCPPEHQLWALLHDASEFAVGDMNRPLKYSPGMGVYKMYEMKAKTAIMEHFGLAQEQPLCVKLADDKMLVTEQRDLMWGITSAGNVQKDRLHNVEPLAEKIVPMSPEQAERTFLMRFYEITGQNRFYEVLGSYESS